MRLATWNILHGKIITKAGADDALTALAKAIQTLDGDLIGLQEVDHFHPRSNSVHQTQNAATAMGAVNWAFAPSFFVVGHDERDIQGSDQLVVTDQDSNEIPAYGIAIISKVPVLKWERLNLQRARFGKIMRISEGAKSKRFYAKDHARSALAAVLSDCIVVNTHLSFVSPFNFFQSREVMRWGERLGKKYQLPVFLMGDFNLHHGTRFSKWKSLGAGLTFPIWEPDRQIDYIMALDEKKSSSKIIALAISDHKALVCDLIP
ncbi:MAG: endonuclease/exonuclease/phosphatase family protein [Actinomycetes bacterium]